MTMKNRRAIHARISEPRFRQIVRLFAPDPDVTQIAALAGLNRNTINRYPRGIREPIAEYCEYQSPFPGEIEVDGSCFGARCIKGKRGRGAFGKTAVFGIFTRNGCVYTEIAPAGILTGTGLFNL